MPTCRPAIVRSRDPSVDTYASEKAEAVKVDEEIAKQLDELEPGLGDAVRTPLPEGLLERAAEARKVEREEKAIAEQLAKLQEEQDRVRAEERVKEARERERIQQAIAAAKNLQAELAATPPAPPVQEPPPPPPAPTVEEPLPRPQSPPPAVEEKKDVVMEDAPDEREAAERAALLERQREEHERAQKAEREAKNARLKQQREQEALEREQRAAAARLRKLEASKRHEQQVIEEAKRRAQLRVVQEAQRKAEQAEAMEREARNREEVIKLARGDILQPSTPISSPQLAAVVGSLWAARGQGEAPPAEWFAHPDIHARAERAYASGQSSKASLSLQWPEWMPSLSTFTWRSEEPRRFAAPPSRPAVVAPRPASATAAQGPSIFSRVGGALSSLAQSAASAIPDVSSMQYIRTPAVSAPAVPAPTPAPLPPVAPAPVAPAPAPESRYKLPMSWYYGNAATRTQNPAPTMQWDAPAPSPFVPQPRPANMWSIAPAAAPAAPEPPSIFGDARLSVHNQHMVSNFGSIFGNANPVKEQTESIWGDTEPEVLSTEPKSVWPDDKEKEETPGVRTYTTYVGGGRQIRRMAVQGASADTPGDRRPVPAAAEPARPVRQQAARSVETIARVQALPPDQKAKVLAAAKAAATERGIPFIDALHMAYLDHRDRKGT